MCALLMLLLALAVPSLACSSLNPSISSIYSALYSAQVLNQTVFVTHTGADQSDTTLTWTVDYSGEPCEGLLVDGLCELQQSDPSIAASCTLLHSGSSNLTSSGSTLASIESLDSMSVIQ
jgi:hypothetical protein